MRIRISAHPVCPFFDIPMDFPRDIRLKLMRLTKLHFEDVVDHLELAEAVLIDDGKKEELYRKLRNHWFILYPQNPAECPELYNWLNEVIEATCKGMERPKLDPDILGKSKQRPVDFFCHSKLDGITMQISHLLTEMGEIKTTLNARPCITK